MANLIKLEQQLLAHDLEGTDFLCILLLSQKHLTIATLSDLCEDLKVALSESYPPLAEIGSFSTGILVPHVSVGIVVGVGRGRVFGLEGIEPGLAVANICEEVKIIVEEVYGGVGIDCQNCEWIIGGG